MQKISTVLSGAIMETGMRDLDTSFRRGESARWTLPPPLPPPRGATSAICGEETATNPCRKSSSTSTESTDPRTAEGTVDDLQTLGSRDFLR